MIARACYYIPKKQSSSSLASLACCTTAVVAARKRLFVVNRCFSRGGRILDEKEINKNEKDSHTDNSATEKDELQNEIFQHTQRLKTFLTSARRSLHEIPELMYQERKTSKYIKGILDENGISYSSGWAVNTHTDVFPGDGGHGIVADIGSGESPCVLLRADMDALPIQEQTDVASSENFQSKHSGRMHACGHDGHTTMLLGAALILKQMENKMHGTVRIMFQPAEEGGAGAKRMIEEGLLENQPSVDVAFGMHLWPTLPSGTIASRPGPLMAAGDRFEIHVTGIGGHAAMPHQTVDPIVTASSIVMNLQTIVSRTTNPFESAVCSIAAIEGGKTFNIIPGTVTLKGTIRAFQETALLSLKDKMNRIVTNTAASHGCSVDIKYSPDYYPPLINDENLYSSFSSKVGALLSKERCVKNLEFPSMASEDFSFIGQHVPSTFFFLGQGSSKTFKSDYGLHHPKFALDENVLPIGVELHVNLALRALKMLKMSNKSQIDLRRKSVRFL